VYFRPPDVFAPAGNGVCWLMVHLICPDQFGEGGG